MNKLLDLQIACFYVKANILLSI